MVGDVCSGFISVDSDLLSAWGHIPFRRPALDAAGPRFPPRKRDRSRIEIALKLRALTRCYFNLLDIWNPVTFTTSHRDRRHTRGDSIELGGAMNAVGF